MNEQTNIVDVSEATFQRDVIERSHQTPVVVDFWAPWCGPCRMLGPTLERLAQEANGDFVLAKVNVDDNQSLAMRYGVRGIPAVKAFVDGAMVDGFVGAQPESRVRAFLEGIAPSETANALAEADRLLSEHAWAGAEAQYRRAGDDPQARLGLARALLGQGKGCEASALLDQITEPSLILTVEWLTPLADYLCATSNGDARRPPPPARYREAAQLIGQGKMEAALDALLELLREDKGYAGGEAKQVVLGLFALLGDEDPLTAEYRPQLASVLF